MRVLVAALLIGFAPQFVPAEDDLKPTHTEVSPIKVPLKGPSPKIDTMGMSPTGELVLAVSWANGNKRQYALQFVNGVTGKVTRRWELGNLAAHIIECASDGSIYVGADGEVVQFDVKGKIARRWDYRAMKKAYYKGAVISGLASDKKHLYVGLAFSFSLRSDSDVYRVNRDLTKPVEVAERQRGCCAHLDLQVVKGELLIAENSRHRINRVSADGKLLGRWGRRDRTGMAGFAACCNPVNFTLAKDGSLYTAESGVGRVKRYSPTGKLLSYVGHVDTTVFDRGSRLAAMSCYIPVEVDKTGDRVYVMDVRANFIRVLVRKSKTTPKTD